LHLTEAVAVCIIIIYIADYLPLVQFLFYLPGIR